ncbi:MAG: PLP-dependent aminotransferase family protein, partial [Spirochaetales bacterium]|nr:PLP-dependent aminotransferase family protein [Candidatus Physcosoma equi]
MRNSLYEELYRSFIAEIKEGRIPSGAKLPSVRKCAEEKGLSLNTVQKAYELLLEEGYIYAKEKSGYYVAEFEASFSSPLKQEKGSSVAKQEHKEEELINLSSNLVDTSAFPYSTLRQLYRETLSGRNNEILEKSGDHQGDYALRKAIAEFVYLHRGVDCTPDEVFIGNGSIYHLQLLASFFGKDAVFFMEDPGFTVSNRILSASNVEIVPVEMDEEGVDVRALRAYEGNRRAPLVLHATPSHEYPMGVTMSAPRRTSLLKWALEGEDRYIVEDDYDSDFRYNG